MFDAIFDIYNNTLSETMEKVEGLSKTEFKEFWKELITKFSIWL